MSMDVIATLALATLVLLAGHQLKQALPPLHRYNLPAPVIGGLLAALVLAVLKQHTTLDIRLDAGARTPLMIAFFTTLGFAASVRLLRLGGRFVFIFLGLSIAAAILQNVAGAGLAVVLGLPPLFGVLCGSVTLTGGPATGLAFAPQFEQAGIAGAEAIAVAAAMCGIILGGMLGGPIGTVLINRLQREGRPLRSEAQPSVLTQVLDAVAGSSDTALLRAIGAILVAMWLGSGVSQLLTQLGVTLPAYIGAMLVAAALRNLDDRTRWLRLPEATVETLGEVALAYFLALSLMTLDLAKLAHVALPLLALVGAQALLTALLSLTLVYRVMGRDYESAVTATGFYGFMMGTTANAMANMDAFVRRYNPAPRAYLVVPIVGAFFIDFANTLLVQACLAWLR